jgi:rhodanese-related sulfurtransferase
MTMTTLSFIPARWLGGAMVGIAFATWAVSPDQVRQRLDSGEKITFVDVRSKSLFQNGHIPGAINIPSQLVPEKQLPPLGHVVVYDGGLGEVGATTAASALNQKSGVSAEILDGGFAAWETAQSTTTQTGGMKPEANSMITYAQLQQVQSADVVLVDLRTPVPASAASAAPAAKAAAATVAVAPLTDLQTEFPKARIVHSPFAGTLKPRAAATAATPPLLVLVDNGDGRAQAMARTLKANGVTRFVILAGGEEILSVHGQAGLQRIGSSVNVRNSSGVSAAAAP